MTFLVPIALTLSLASLPQVVEREKPPAPTPASALSPSVAAEKIKIGIKEASAPAIEVIQTFGLIAGAEVTKAVGKALRHQDEAVRAAALKALRFNKHKSAVSELLKQKRNKLLVADDVLGPKYYLALGQHADVRALPVLRAKLRATRRRDKVVEARLLALGRMRTRSAIDTLIKISRTARGNSRNNVRTALVALTGKDLGNRWIDWTRWWDENRRGYKVDPKEAPLPKKLARGWDRVWNPSAMQKKPGSRRAKRERGKDGKDGAGRNGAGKDGAGKDGAGKDGKGRKRS